MFHGLARGTLFMATRAWGSFPSYLKEEIAMDTIIIFFVLTDHDRKRIFGHF